MAQWPTQGQTTPWGFMLKAYIDAALDAATAMAAGGVQDISRRTAPWSTTNTALNSIAAASVIDGLEVDVVGTGRDVEITFNAPSFRHSVANTAVGFYLLRSVNGGAFAPANRVTLGDTPSAADPLGNRGHSAIFDVPTVEGETYVFRLGVYGGVAGTSTLATFDTYPITLKARNH